MKKSSKSHFKAWFEKMSPLYLSGADCCFRAALIVTDGTRRDSAGSLVNWKWLQVRILTAPLNTLLLVSVPLCKALRNGNEKTMQAGCSQLFHTQFLKVGYRVWPAGHQHVLHCSDHFGFDWDWLDVVFCVSDLRAELRREI
jgi:hypothetical protein